MTIVKSFSVGNGDMFAIRHASDNFTIIDCYLTNDNKDDILGDIEVLGRGKRVYRFISTHPDEDHILGLELLDAQKEILNFYCVKNQAIKKEIQPKSQASFDKYFKLRNSDKAFYIKQGCSRKWMNIGDNERDGANIDILFPVRSNKHFQQALINTENGGSPNNISPIIKCVCENFTFIWMGDLETNFMEKIENDVDLYKVNVLFAPHHGRDTGKVPKSWLEVLDPDLIIIGEAPSEHLNYYNGYNTITQNSAGDITFLLNDSSCKIYVGNPNYSTIFQNNGYKTDGIRQPIKIEGNDFIWGYKILDLVRKD